MRVIIAGSRSFARHPQSLILLKEAIHHARLLPQPIIPSFVISGGAVGIDKSAIIWAKNQTPPLTYYAEPITNEDWARYRGGAGHQRNLRMSRLDPDALIAVHDGLSNGTIDMVTIMRDLGKLVYIYTVTHNYHTK
jgi:hypothetical protein